MHEVLIPQVQLVQDRVAPAPLGCEPDDPCLEVTEPARLKGRADRLGRGSLHELEGCCFGQVFLDEGTLDELVGKVDAFVADVHARTGDDLLHLFLRLAAE